MFFKNLCNKHSFTALYLTLPVTLSLPVKNSFYISLLSRTKSCGSLHPFPLSTRGSSLMMTGVGPNLWVQQNTVRNHFWPVMFGSTRGLQGSQLLVPGPLACSSSCGMSLKLDQLLVDHFHKLWAIISTAHLVGRTECRLNPGRGGGSIVGTKGVKNTKWFSPQNHLSRAHRDSWRLKEQSQSLHGSSAYMLWLFSLGFCGTPNSRS